MKHLRGALVACAAFAALPACIITDTNDPPPNTGGFCGDGVVNAGEQCDDRNNVSGDGCSATCQTEQPPIPTARLSTTWRLENVATNQETQCPAGFDTAAVISQRVDVNGNALGQPTIDLFDCVDGAGVVDLDADLYVVWIEIGNTNGTQTYAQSTSAYVDLTTADQTFNATILNDGGYFELSWELQTAANQPRTCAQVPGITGVGVISTSVANPQMFTDDKFTCEDYYGITGGLLAGTYTVAVDALGAGDASIGRSPVLTSRVIQDRNRVTDLGNVVITLD